MWKRLAAAGPTVLAPWAIPIAVVLFLSVNVIAALSFDSARLDLTENDIYTVSDSTQEVLGSLTEPVTIRLYWSSALITQAPELRVYADRVSELLRSYQQLSGGRVRVERVDPVPFSPAEDRAIGYNLAGFNLSRSGERGYFGVVGTNAVDQLEVIEVLSPSRERYLEYELTRMVIRLSTPTEPRIGVFDGLGVFGSMEQGRAPSALIERLGDDYALLPVEDDAAALPRDLDALLIIHPHKLALSALYAIDQYVLGGGPALVFLDPLAEHSPPDPTNQTRPLYPESTLQSLLSGWGLTMLDKKVVGDIGMALEIRGQAGAQVAITKYPPWLVVDADNLSRTDVAVARLNLMRMSSPGALEPVAGAGTILSPLVVTTPATMLYDQTVLMRRNDPRELVSMFASSETVRTLAARVSGAASTAFPDGAPASAAAGQTQSAATAPAQQLTASTQPIDVVVVADTDMLADDHNIDRDGQQTTQNMDFVVNAIDSMTGGGALAELRARGLTFRPFSRLDEIEASARARYQATEQQLETELQQTEERLAQLRAGAPGENGEFGEVRQASQQAITEFNQRIVVLRERLRDVQASLRTDVEALTSWLRLANIAAVPLMIVLAGVLIALWRKLRLGREVRRRHVPGSA